MTEEKILEGNKLIAEFMGFTQKSYTPDSEKMWCDAKHGLPVGQLMFHLSYDWIMPVVHKITEQIHNRSVPSSAIEVYVRKIATMHLSNSVESIYISVLEYIGWYNSPEGKHALAIDDE